MGNDQLKEVLARFGHEDFREGQREPIEAVLRGEDAVVVMPTGAGKSLCYQVTALMLPGTTLVVSPLIALMKTRLSMVAIDEAHCISQWGHDFRPDYLDLGGFIGGLGEVRVMALTATATPGWRDERRFAYHDELARSHSR